VFLDIVGNILILKLETVLQLPAWNIGQKKGRGGDNSMGWKIGQ